jgi:hypothetical protein
MQENYMKVITYFSKICIQITQRDQSPSSDLGAQMPADSSGKGLQMPWIIGINLSSMWPKIVPPSLVLEIDDLKRHEISINLAKWLRSGPPNQRAPLSKYLPTRRKLRGRGRDLAPCHLVYRIRWSLNNPSSPVHKFSNPSQIDLQSEQSVASKCPE